jgi:G3E family GTPase
MRIPVIIVSGFLGSGKTTLLLRLLAETKRRGLQAGVLMNELGERDVDGLIVDELHGASLEKLLDGCVCCSKKSELAGSLSQLVHTKPDVIIIELTGVANPEEIADALSEPQLIRQLYMKQVITLLDAEHALDYNSIFSSDKQLVQTLRRQLETADYIIVNKTDLVRPAHLHKIEKAVRKQNERALIAYTVQSRVDLNPILDSVSKYTGAAPASLQRVRIGTAARLGQAVPKEIQHGKHEHEHQLSFSRLRTLTLHWDAAQAPVTRKQFEAFLHRWKDQLIRAKGYLPFSGQGQTYLMQYAGKRIYWEPAAYSGEFYIVAIGIELDEERMIAEWRSFCSRTG